MSEEIEYVMVESGTAPTLENNLMPNIVLLTDGEAQHTNEQLESFNSTQRYFPLIKDDCEKELR